VPSVRANALSCGLKSALPGELPVLMEALARSFGHDVRAPRRSTSALSLFEARILFNQLLLPKTWKADRKLGIVANTFSS
jgi:hypothetical protein